MFDRSIPNVVESVEPSKLASFLLLDGWKERRVANSCVRVFQKTRGDEFFQVDLPTDKELFDFKRAIFNALKTTAKADETTFERVALAALFPIADVLKFRLISPISASGCVPLDVAVKLYANAKKMLTDAAKEIDAPNKAERFANACRFAQTEVGSYAFSVVAPLESDETTQEFKQTDDARLSNSVARRATSRAFNSADAILNALNGVNPVDELTRGVERGVWGLDFLKTLCAFASFGVDDKTEISARFSDAATENRPTNDAFILERRFREPMTRAIETIKRDVAPKNVAGVGKIERLEARADVEARTFGVAVVTAMFESGKTQKRKLRLAPNDYSAACEAHKQGAFARFSGELVDDEILCDAFQIWNAATNANAGL